MKREADKRHSRRWVGTVVNAMKLIHVIHLRGKKLTIVDLIRREGREPGGKPCAQVWVVKWGKETRYLEYPTLEPIPIRMLEALILTSSRWWRFKRWLKKLLGRLYSFWRSWN